MSITDVAFGGKGVARVDGKTVFVPFVIDGETVEATITRQHKKFSEAAFEQVTTPSPHRVEPRCPYFGVCGGCVYQHIAYEHQLSLKWRQVRETLRRVGKIENPPMRPLVPSPLDYEYRNRVTVHAHNGVVGYFRRESNSLVDVEQCPIAAPAVNAQLADLRKERPRDGHYTLRARDTPRVFQQTNDEVSERLLETAARAVDEANPISDTLIDAYCGAGFFTKHLRARFARVIGIDWDRHAVREAQRHALSHESYVAGEIDEELPRQLGVLKKPPVLIVDPPADGLSKAIREALLRHSLAQLIYISCSPATLARDLGELTKNLRLNSVTPFDMFPQTAEIECLVSLSPK